MTIKYKKIRRVVITGPNEERRVASDFCFRNGYTLIRSGPRYAGFPRIDPNRFKIIAEKEI